MSKMSRTEIEAEDIVATSDPRGVRISAREGGVYITARVTCEQGVKVWRDLADALGGGGLAKLSPTIQKLRDDLTAANQLLCVALEDKINAERF